MRSQTRRRSFAVAVPLPSWQRALTGLVVAEAGLVALHLLGLATDSTLLKLSSEDNIPTWFSSAQFVLAGLACWLASLEGGPARTAWIALALLMTAFSVDEIARFHERFEVHEGAKAAIVVIEPIVAVVIAGFVWSARRHLHRTAARLLAAAAGSIVLSQAFATVDEELEPSGVALQLLAIPEEVLEMLAGTFVLAAALAFLASRQSSKNA